MAVFVIMCQNYGYVLVIISLLICNQEALDNGLLLTPPMGWLAWERFKCNTDCENFPNHCISEKLFIEMADRLVEDGYRNVGYNRINIDDCWMTHSRDDRGNLRTDRRRFSKGIKFLAKYMHDRDLKLGIYGDYGTHTCMGYPGIHGSHMQADANRFAKWNVDMLKLDGCHSELKMMDQGYPEMERSLNRTGRQIVLSCSWPYYQIFSGIEPDYKLIKKHCNLWRNFHDITTSWSSIKSVIDFNGDNQEVLVPHAGPGHWNDPDMILVGNEGLSFDQSQVQMGMWAIFAAPLFMSNDLRDMSPDLKEILVNTEVIGINQDPLGIQGKRIFVDEGHGIEIWARPISPTYQLFRSFAIAILNSNIKHPIKKVKFTLKQLGLTFDEGYRVTDSFSHDHLGLFYFEDGMSLSVKPTGIRLLKFTLNNN